MVEQHVPLSAGKPWQDGEHNNLTWPSLRKKQLDIESIKGTNIHMVGRNYSCTAKSLIKIKFIPLLSNLFD
jgi:hypothetical protein